MERRKSVKVADISQIPAIQQPSLADLRSGFPRACDDDQSHRLVKHERAASRAPLLVGVGNLLTNWPSLTELQSWPKGFGTPPLFHVFFYGIYS